MATPTPTYRSKQQIQAAQNRHQKFIDRQRLVLLSYLDGTMPANGDERNVVDYIESVLTEWEEQFRHDDIADPDPRERTFWYALYQLEELVENCSPPLDPYETFLMQNIAEVRELLRNREPLPVHRFMATRPDGR
jgi:hypothetical protein